MDLDFLFFFGGCMAMPCCLCRVVNAVYQGAYNSGVVLNFERVGCVVGEVFSPNLAKTERWKTAEVRLVVGKELVSSSIF